MSLQIVIPHLPAGRLSTVERPSRKQIAFHRRQHVMLFKGRLKPAVHAIDAGLVEFGVRRPALYSDDDHGATKASLGE